jgi:hypothetical protein
MIKFEIKFTLSLRKDEGWTIIILIDGDCRGDKTLHILPLYQLSLQIASGTIPTHNKSSSISLQCDKGMRTATNGIRNHEKYFFRHKRVN